jgi:hypothetical protein
LGDLDSRYSTDCVLDTATAKTVNHTGSPCGGIPIELEWRRQFERDEDA